jgi:hypothetical protein
LRPHAVRGCGRSDRNQRDIELDDLASQKVTANERGRCLPAAAGNVAETSAVPPPARTKKADVPILPGGDSARRLTD